MIAIGLLALGLTFGLGFGFGQLIACAQGQCLECTYKKRRAESGKESR